MIKNLPQKSVAGVNFSQEEIDILYKNALRVMKVDLKELRIEFLWGQLQSEEGCREVLSGAAAGEIGNTQIGRFLCTTT